MMMVMTAALTVLMAGLFVAVLMLAIRDWNSFRLAARIDRLVDVDRALFDAQVAARAQVPVDSMALLERDDPRPVIEASARDTARKLTTALAELRSVDLTGRAALVTGGSKGLGKAMARGLTQAGANVVISSRNEDALKAAAREIGAGAAGKVQYVVADMTSRDDVARLAEKAASAFGRIDVLVNNAGDNKPEPIDQIKDEVWDDIIELNLSSCMALTRALVPAMKAR